MASINPTNAPATPPLDAARTSIPLPRAIAASTPNALPFELPTSVTSFGGNDGGGYSILDGTTVIGGGGTTPAPGAQPASPNAAAANAAAGANATGATAAANGAAAPAAGATSPFANDATLGSTVPQPVASAIVDANGALVSGTATPTAANSSPNAADATGAATAAATSGFGKAERSKKMVAGVGDATFSFPSFNASAKSTAAPAITWGAGWTKVEKNGMYYMQHTNGTKAIPAVEYRITPTPADKVQTIKVANGWGKKLPDGTVIVFDRDKGPYRLDPKGAKHALPFGTQTFGGVKIRVFEATVVRTLEPNGAVTVFDSRGNTKAGTRRTSGGGGLLGASAGASGGGGSVTQSDGTTVGGGSTTAQLTSQVEKITAAARALLAQVNGGTMDAAAFAQLQAQLAALPAGLTAALAGNGTLVASTETAPATSGGGSVDQTAVGGASGGGAAGMPPTPGVDANAAVRMMVQPETKQITGSVPADVAGKRMRFGQLAPELQESVAKAFGSTEGGAAFDPDVELTVSASGSVTVHTPMTPIHLRHVNQVTGGGPGDDLAMTMRPGRQPGRKPASQELAAALGGGGTTVGGGGPSAPTPTAPTVPTVPGLPPTTPAPGSAALPAPTATKLPLFTAGQQIGSQGLGAFSGSFTWKSLPAAARTIILDYIRSHPESAAGRAFAARSAGTWAVDPNTKITLGAGFATFPDGLALHRAATTGGGGATPTQAPSAPTPGGGSMPGMHHPPSNTGGPVPTAPPTPTIPGAGAGDGHDHTH